MLKSIITATVTSLLVSLIVLGLVGGNHQSAPGFGGVTNYDILAAGVRLAAGSSTPATNAEVIADGTGTTTLLLTSTAVNTAGCIQTKNAAGAPTTAYIGIANTWIIATSSAASCK